MNVLHQTKTSYILYTLKCLYIYTMKNRVLTLTYESKNTMSHIIIDPCHILFYNIMIYVSIWKEIIDMPITYLEANPFSSLNPYLKEFREENYTLLLNIITSQYYYSRDIFLI